jgi:hypothetical protein
MLGETCLSVAALLAWWLPGIAYAPPAERGMAAVYSYRGGMTDHRSYTGVETGALRNSCQEILPASTLLALCLVDLPFMYVSSSTVHRELHFHYLIFYFGTASILIAAVPTSPQLRNRGGARVW